MNEKKNVKIVKNKLYAWIKYLAGIKKSEISGKVEMFSIK